MTATDHRDDRRRVLLVGGEPPLVAVLRDYFRLGDRYDIESIEFCDDALMLLRRQPFDLVLVLSVNAPWRAWSSLSSPAQSSLGAPAGRIEARHIEASSAILFLKQMRGLLDPPPVVVVSGHQGARATALANGAVAYILKPILLAELDEALQNALNGTATR